MISKHGIEMEENEEFAKWWKQWRVEIQRHISTEQIHPEKKEDDVKIGSENRSISKTKDTSPEPTMAGKH
jgi:hypothetical protein